MYTPQVAEHIANPRNVGELENPSGTGDVTNQVCMDRIRLTVRLDGDRVSAARVKASGCPPTIAAASVLTELIIGRALVEVQARKLCRAAKPDDAGDVLGAGAAVALVMPASHLLGQAHAFLDE